MEFMIDPQIPTISPGDWSYYVYLILLILAFYIVFRAKNAISRNKSRVLLIFMILAVFQRLMINFWYLIIDEYTLAYSLPLQICRVVVWLVILQYFFRKEFLDQTIFYIGLFAYGAFFYPIGIHPVTHMAGWSFFLMHSINVVFPFAMHFATGFVPTFKGLLQAYSIFVGYFFLVYFINPLVGGNYFFINERPFLHDLDEAAYVPINLVGTFIGFLLVYLIIRQTAALRDRWQRPR